MLTYYSFARKLSISVHTGQKRYIHYFNDEYYFARVSKKIPVDIELRIVDKLPSLQKQDKVIIRSLHFKHLFWFEYMVDLRKPVVVIYMKRHVIERLYFKAIGPFIQTNVLEPVLYYVAILKGYYLLHASCVAKNNEAYCFVGHGGAGKTMTALNKCVKEGYNFMGDDLALIAVVDRKVHYFPRPLHLFGYNLFKIPYPTRFREQVFFWKVYTIIKFKDIIRFVLSVLTKEKPLISTRAHMRELYPQIKLTTEAKLKTVDVIGLDRTHLVEEIIKASDLRMDLVALFEKQHALFKRFIHNEHALLTKLFSHLG